MTQAVILAAGVGSRLRPLTDDRPKALVRVGAEPILGLALDTLLEAGIKSTIIVTGYRQDAVTAFLSRRGDVTVATVENPAYASTNTLASFCVAAPLVDDDFVLIDGDLVFEPAVIARLSSWKESIGHRSILSRALGGPGARLAVDTSRRLDDEAVKVALDDDRVVAVGKTLPAGFMPVAESIGIARIDQATAARLVPIGRRLLERGATQAYYEAAFQALIEEGHPFEAADVAGLRWVEIDDHEDLERARDLFAPR
jgi:choline kinase